MEKKLKYHFSTELGFEADVDVKKLSKKFGLEPFRLIEKKDAKDKYKTAKIIYRSENFNHVFVDEELDKYVARIKDNFVGLADILKEYNGYAELEVVFNGLDDFPYVGMSNETMKTLAELGMRFGTDVILQNM